MPAYVPNWSADGKIVSYSVDTTNTLDLQAINYGMDSIVEQLFSSGNHDSYFEYVLDQPDNQGAVYSPQLIGQVAYNELDLAQCPSNAASTCPNKPNTPYVQVSQMGPGAGSILRMLTIGDSSTINQYGGMLFQDGIVTAVFPPNALASDTVIFNTDPTAYCGGVGLPDCPPDPTTEYIVQAGDAREFFPDGTNFASYVRLIFHYCDNDNNGKIDAGTENVVSATANGTKSFTFNPMTSACSIDGVATTGGTVDVDTLAVYNWDQTASAWVKLDGMVDKTSKTITVFSTHFSRYDTLGFRMGFAPQAIVPLQIENLHTYPNPYVESKNRADGIHFAADKITTNETVSVGIRIYDLRGSLVNTLMTSITGTEAPENNAQPVYTWRPVTNASGRPLASGVYMYYLDARTPSGHIVTQKGTFSIVR